MLGALAPLHALAQVEELDQEFGAVDVATSVPIKEGKHGLGFLGA